MATKYDKNMYHQFFDGGFRKIKLIYVNHFELTLRLT